MAVRRPTLFNVNTDGQPTNQTQYPFNSAPSLPRGGVGRYFNQDSPDLQEHRGWTETSSEETDEEGKHVYI